MAQSKMSLNVMSWHKGGMTERLNNAMLNKSLCVTDETTYIKREFPNEMLQFNLEDYSDLPERVKALLDDDAARDAMVRRAYEKAIATQTWECRAKEFLQILEDVN
jgi:spore maturation protein CgeB